MLAHVNVGTGDVATIRELGELISGAVSYEGKLEFDEAKPDETPRKLLDVSRINKLGWSAKVPMQ